MPGGKNRKWTVLLGENGTGKSTILKAIALLMAGSDALVDLVANPNDWIRIGQKQGAIEGSIETKRGEVRDLKLVFKRNQSISAFINQSVKTLEPLNDALEHSSRNYMVIGYGASRRLTTGKSSVSLEKQQPRARSMASLFNRNAELNPLEQWAMDLDYQSNGQKMGTVKKVLSDFLPELTFTRIDKKARTLLFNTADGLVPLEQLSDGYQNVAAWVGDLLYQISEIFQDYKNPLKARGLLIIDEVDLHLHPKWQRSLLSFLEERLPNMQLVVTTHSVVTAQQSPQDALFYCIRRQGKAPEIVAFEGNPGKLLLNQLIVTEAFGHIPDESVNLQSSKARYRKLHKKKRKTAKDKDEMKELSKTIDETPELTSERIVLTEKQHALIQKMLNSQMG